MLKPPRSSCITYALGMLPPTEYVYEDIETCAMYTDPPEGGEYVVYKTQDILSSDFFVVSLVSGSTKIIDHSVNSVVKPKISVVIDGRVFGNKNSVYNINYVNGHTCVCAFSKNEKNLVFYI